MLVAQESIGRGIGVNAIKHQFTPAMARQAGHRQTVAEVPPRELTQSRYAQFYANEIFQRGVQYRHDDPTLPFSEERKKPHPKNKFVRRGFGYFGDLGARRLLALVLLAGPPFWSWLVSPLPGGFVCSFSFPPPARHRRWLPILSEKSARNLRAGGQF
jgi:hypothetical protein